jgi:hypothetical protein
MIILAFVFEQQNTIFPVDVPKGTTSITSGFPDVGAESLVPC